MKCNIKEKSRSHDISHKKKGKAQNYKFNIWVFERISKKKRRTKEILSSLFFCESKKNGYQSRNLSKKYDGISNASAIEKRVSIEIEV